MLTMSCLRNSPVVFNTRHLVAWVTVVIACSRCQDHSVKTCLEAAEDAPMVNVTLTCPEGRVISLGEVVSSVNRYGLCINALGDCTDTTDVFNPCQRQRECTVTLNRTYSPICTAYATQLKVYYVCEVVPTLTTTAFPVTATSSRATEVVAVSSRRTQYDQSAPAPTQEDNTGLIAGCVVAVVITVILLIIAIIMVVRRLACAPPVTEAENGKGSGCEILPCVTATDEKKNSKCQPGADRNIDSSSKRNWNWRPRHTDKNQNMSPRLAPVGQEDEGTGSTANPGNLQENRRSMPDPNKEVVASMDAVKVKKPDFAASDSAVGEVAAFATDGRATDRERRVAEEWKRASGGVKRKSREVSSALDPDDVITSLGGAFAGHPAAPSKSSRPVLAAKAGARPGAQTALGRFDAVAVPNTETSTSC